MAIVTLRIPDATLEAYKGMHPSNPSHAMEKQLERFKTVPHDDRALIFPKLDRRELEGLFGRPIEDTSGFVGWVKRLVSLKVDDLTFPLKPGQLKHLEGRALFHKVPTPDFIRATISRILDREFGNY